MAAVCARSVKVAALYVQAETVYRGFENVEVYDLARDASKYQGPWPVVAHPPCRSWGRLRHLAKPREGEWELAVLAIEQVRKYGGVLEHPVGSALFEYVGISRKELWRVNQVDWGHRAIKPTWLFLVGCEPPLELRSPGVPTTTVERMCRHEREKTPHRFAKMLIELAASARR